MNSTELVRYHRAFESRAQPRADQRATPPFCTELAGPVRRAILRAKHYLIAERSGDGLWLGRQAADASLVSLLVFWLVYTGSEDSDLAEQCAATLFDLQLPNGAWPRVAGGLMDLNVSVQSYFALKLLGIEPSSRSLARSRKTIVQCCGADAADSTTRYILALFGQIDYDCCTDCAPERLAAIGAHPPVCNIDIERGVRELFVRQPSEWSLPTTTSRPCSSNATDAVPIDRLQFDELVWHAIALRATGLAPESSELIACESRLRELVYVDEIANTAVPQLAPSPLADTALVIRALLTGGMSSNHVVLSTATASLTARLPAELAIMRTDELSAVLAALKPHGEIPGDESGLPPAIEVCDEWSDGAFDQQAASPEGSQFAAPFVEIVDELLRRQVSDGGWGDPAITTVLESLRGRDSDEATLSIERAISYLQSAQLANGGWCSGDSAGRIETTAFAINGLLSAGVTSGEFVTAAAANWLIVQQQSDGGWSEAIDDEPDVEKESAAAPTAWALLALVAAGKANHSAVRRGIDFLLDTQDDDGRWIDGGCENDLHSIAWPLLALSRWAVAADSTQSAPASEMSLRLVGVSAEN